MFKNLSLWVWVSLLLVGMPIVAIAVPEQLRIMASQRISVKDGLAHEAVLAITQDADNIMWLGTVGGIQSFDGLHFSTIRSVSTDKSTLPGNGIFALHKGEGSYLWAGVRNAGLVRFNIHSNEILRVTQNGYSFDAAEKYYVLSICEDDQQTVWAATSNGLLYASIASGMAKFIKFDDTLAVSRVHKVQCGTQGIFALADNLILLVDKHGKQVVKSMTLPIGNGNNINDFSLALDDQGNIYAGSSKGVVKVDSKLTHANKLWPLPGQKDELVRVIRPMDEQHLWLGTETQGVILFNERTGTVINQLAHDSDNPESSILSSNIYDLYFDNSGILWIAGAGLEWVAVDTPGIISFANKPQNDSQNKQGSVDSNVISSFIDEEQNYWQLSLPNGINYLPKGAKQFVSKTAEFNQLFKSKYPGTSPYMTVLMPDGKGNFWISANKGFIFWQPNSNDLHYYNKLNTPNQQPDKRSLDIIKDDLGVFWFTQYGGVLYYQSDTDTFIKIPLPNNKQDKVVQFLADGSDILVLSTHKLYRLSPFERTLTEIVPVKNSLLSGQFVAIRQSNNQLWIAGDGGLVKASLTQKIQIDYTDISTQSIVDNTFHSLEIDAFNRVWLSSNKGIYRYSPKRQIFEHFSIGDGVTVSDYFDRSSFITPNKQLYFGGVGGWVVIDPAKLPQHPTPPAIKLWSIQIGDQQNRYSRQQQSITMDMEEHWLKMDFSAIDYHAPRQNKYAFMLEGDDNQWHYTGSDSTVTYTGLSPGKYVLHAKAASLRSDWSQQELRLPITVLPPWYRATIAYVCYGLLSLAMLLAFAWRRYQLGLERQRYLAKIERSEQQMKLAIWGSGDSIWDWHVQDNRVQRIGLAFLGYRDDELDPSPKGFQALIHPQDLVGIEQAIDSLLNGQTTQIASQYRIKHKSGHWHWIADRGKVVESVNNKPTRLSGTLKDISKLKAQELALKDLNSHLEDKVEQRTISLADKNDQLEHTIETLQDTQIQLVEAEKMAALGKVVAGVAHELNTPLGITTTAASCLDRDITDIDQKITQANLTKKDLVSSISKITDSNKLIIKNIARTANLVNTFKQIAIETEQTTTTQLPELVEQVVEAIQTDPTQPKYTIKVINQQPFSVQSIPAYLHLLLDKLIQNSLSHGFSLTLKQAKNKEQVKDKAHQITITIEKHQDSWTLIYNDNGCGIDETTATQIFEPFYTTKRHAGHTGLGMHIVYNLVTQGLKGSLSCDNGQYGGLMVKMILPL